MGGDIRNVADGNAWVGVQAGHIYGDVSIGRSPESGLDPAARLADLHARLRKARTAGEVDEDTFTAAQEELAVVSESLAESTEQGKSRAMIALKRLRGLLVDVADLAAKVAAVIAAVRGVS